MCVCVCVCEGRTFNDVTTHLNKTHMCVVTEAGATVNDPSIHLCVSMCVCGRGGAYPILTKTDTNTHRSRTTPADSIYLPARHLQSTLMAPHLIPNNAPGPLHAFP